MITNDISMLEAVRSEEYVDIDNIYSLVPMEVRLHMQRVNRGCMILTELLQKKSSIDEPDFKNIALSRRNIFKYHDIGYGFLPIKTYCNTEDENKIFDIKKFFELDFSGDGMFLSHTELGEDAYVLPLFRYKKEEMDLLASQVSMYHHEKWDGSGFPNGLKEKEIPLAARICAVMDMYDMFSQYYPCTEQNKNKYVIEALTQVSGEYLQPELVEVVKENADIFYNNDCSCGNISMF